jgi:MFS family permease
VHIAKSLLAFLLTVATAGGLLAAGIVNMQGVGGKAGWAWIFILEGLFTVLCAIASYLIIADFPEHAKFLSETESTCVCLEFPYKFNSTSICLAGVFVVRRLQDDMQFSAGGEKFQAKYIWQSLRDWKTWIASMILVSNLRASS